MGSSSTGRTLLLAWYITVPGVLLSLALAAVVSTTAPRQYSSNGTAVLLRPEQAASAAGANPLLNFDTSLNTTAMLLVQQLTAPSMPAELGLVPGKDTYSVRNAGSVAVTDGVEQPFISVTAQSPDPARSTAIVSQVMSMARQVLAQRQSTLRVPKRGLISVQTVVEATPAKTVLAVPLAAGGLSFLLGLGITVTIALLSARRAARAPDILEIIGDQPGSHPMSAQPMSTQQKSAQQKSAQPIPSAHATSSKTTSEVNGATVTKPVKGTFSI